MNRGIIAILAITALAVGGCKSKSGTPVEQLPKKVEIPDGTGKKGKVAKTMNQGGYTYIEILDDTGQSLWLASPEIKVSEGDKVVYQETQPMVNFKSRTLNKTFDKIYFVPGVKVEK